LSLSYKYHPDGIAPSGVRIEDIPVVRLVLRRRDIGKRAVGTSIVDTGFDGGIYPNLQILTFFEGLKPMRIDRLGSVFGESIECEVYTVEASLISEDGNLTIDLGNASVYIPTDPDYIGDEVLIGREILNRLGITLIGKEKILKVGNKLRTPKIK